MSKLNHVLVKRGLYYRPNNCGYTGILDNAGRYSAGEARPDSGVFAIHEDDAPIYAPACFHDLAAEHLAERAIELSRRSTDLPQLQKLAAAFAALVAGFPDGHGLPRKPL